MDDVNKKPEKKEYVPANGKLFPAKPGFMDYVKEAFEPDNTRAQLDAMRRRREQMGKG